VAELHGEAYAKDYQKKDSRRITRLIPLIEKSNFGVLADIGCGTGMLLDAIGEKFTAYHGVDLSPDMLGYARQRRATEESPEVIWHQEDIVSFLTRRPNTFDNVFALDLSEHVDDDVWAGILAGVAIALKPEGSFYIHTPNREYIIEVLKHVGILKQFPEHIAVRAAVQNSRRLQDAGFQLVSCKFLSHYEPRQKPLALLSYVPFLGRFLGRGSSLQREKVRIWEHYLISNIIQSRNEDLANRTLFLRRN